MTSSRATATGRSDQGHALARTLRCDSSCHFTLYKSLRAKRSNHCCLSIVWAEQKYAPNAFGRQVDDRGELTAARMRNHWIYVHVRTLVLIWLSKIILITRSKFMQQKIQYRVSEDLLQHLDVGALLMCLWAAAWPKISKLYGGIAWAASDCFQEVDTVSALWRWQCTSSLVVVNSNLLNWDHRKRLLALYFFLALWEGTEAKPKQLRPHGVPNESFWALGRD